MRRWYGILGMLVMAVFAAGQAFGQSAPQPAAQDKPAAGVARISQMQGDVSVQRGDSGDWVAATLNTPVMAGDKISTGQKSLTELQLDYANMLRLSNQSAANVTVLDSTHIQLQVAQGLAFYTVFQGAEADAEIDTPNVAIHPRGEGEFRIQVNSSNETVLAVRKGEADISTSEGSTHVQKGQMITVRGAGADAQFLIADAPSRDSWDRFNEDRDNRIRSAQSWTHVDPYYTGADDLDAYGRWTNVPDYGSVWSPTVAPDWAPYRDGNWVWEPYYGWTWVSDEPWGWAPYHYGRWFYRDSAWCWWPGMDTPWYRPIWAPAYVSFFGFGAGRFGLDFGFGFGFGSVGWLPIGPCDPYFPWYGGGGYRFGFADFNRFRDRDFYRGHPGAIRPLSARFDERYSNFHMAERDPRFLRGVTSVRAEEFGRGMNQRAVGVSINDLRNGHMMTGGVPAVPTRESLAPSSRAANPSTIRNDQGTRFFSRSQTPAAPRASFNEQAGRVQEALRGNRGSSTPSEGIQRGGATPGGVNRPGAQTQPAPSTRPGVVSAGAPNRGGQAAGGAGNWQRLGGSNGTGTPAGNASTAQPSRGAVGSARPGSAASSTPSYRPPIYRPQSNPGTQNSRPQQNAQPGVNSGGWQRFTQRPAATSPQSPTGRGNGAVSPPRYQGSQSSGRGQVPSYTTRPNYSAPSYNSRPNYSAPSYGSRPNYSAPSYGSRPNYSAPSYNSRPNYSGPSYNSRPNYSAPSYSSRPPLNLSRPIITGPPRGTQSRGSAGSSSSAPRQGSSGRSSGPSRRR